MVTSISGKSQIIEVKDDIITIGGQNINDFFLECLRMQGKEGSFITNLEIAVQFIDVTVKVVDTDEEQEQEQDEYHTNVIGFDVSNNDYEEEYEDE